jgi:hypothetical protein
MTKKQKFEDDLEKLYNYLQNRKDTINLYYQYLENKEYSKLKLIDDFAKNLDLSITDDVRMAVITRLVNLRDDSLVQVLKKSDFNEEQIIQAQEKAYLFVSDFWINIHKNTIDFIKSNNLLTPFYQAIFEGVYKTGIMMSKWQISWTKLIINTVNKELLAEFNNDEEKIMQYLEKNNLLDKGHNGTIADRCYSMLVKDENGNYQSVAYSRAFKEEVYKVKDELEILVDNLLELEDDVYDNKWEYVLYIQSIVKALGEYKTNTLIQRWAEVDRAWMKIKTPIQIGHPLEYYEDHFRKAVALEWDIRVSSPTLQNNNQRVKKIKSMFEKIYNNIDKEKNNQDIYNFSLNSLDKVQLYLGRPALFFAAEFNGLFSAQVVPNDEIVSLEEGKKIFAFSDEILQSQRAKPFLKLSRKILGQEILTLDRKVLFQNPKKWHQVYDITTIGHEFGHILWCDENTETIMNKTGNFKNIEEFKATTGGLVSFFLDDSNNEQNCLEQVLIDTIKRAVGLIAWMEVDEVQPYYCEGLIHLQGLFDSSVLVWDDDNKKLSINLDKTSIENLKQWYINTYKSLARHYLDQKDATIWLNQYAKKNDKYFLPVDLDIKKFVEYYFGEYKAIGQELDDMDSKDNYLQ